MKTFLRFSIIASLFFSLAANAQKPVVKGHIEGLGNDSILVVVSPYSKENFNANDVYTYDIVAQDGKFVLDSLPNIPVAVRIDLRWHNRKPNEKYGEYFGNIMLMLNPDDNINIEGELKDKYVDYTVEGSHDNNAWAEISIAAIPYKIKIMSIQYDMFLLREREPSPQRDSMILKYKQELDEIFKQKSAPYIAFIENNPDSDVVASMLDEVSPTELLRLYPMLSERIRTGALGMAIMPYYDMVAVELTLRDKQEKIADGQPVLDFTLKTMNGNDFILSNVEKEYTIIDFWSDGCSPCLEEMPVIRRYYEKYGDRIEFISIGCLITEGTWRSTIESYGMVWTQAMDDSNDPVQVKYNVRAFPTKYVIDNKQRKVFAYQGLGDEFWVRIDELMK